MKNDLTSGIALAHAFLSGANLVNYITMFQTLGGAIANGRVPSASNQELDEALEAIAEGGRHDNNALDCSVECAEFLQMLRQTRQDISQ